MKIILCTNFPLSLQIGSNHSVFAISNVTHVSLSLTLNMKSSQNYETEISHTPAATTFGFSEVDFFGGEGSLVLLFVETQNKVHYRS
jgi:hypothetical protein